MGDNPGDHGDQPPPYDGYQYPGASAAPVAGYPPGQVLISHLKSWGLGCVYIIYSNGSQGKALGTSHRLQQYEYTWTIIINNFRLPILILFLGRRLPSGCRLSASRELSTSDIPSTGG